MQSNCSEKAEIIIVRFSCIFLKVRQLTVRILKRDSGRTAYWQPIGISLSRAANTVKFVNLKNLHFVLDLSFVHDSITSVFFKISFNFAMSSLLLTSFDCSNGVLFSWAYKYLKFLSSIFLGMKPRAKVSFATHFSLSRTRSNFSWITWAVRFLTTKIEHTMSPFLYFRINQEMSTRL